MPCSTPTPAESPNPVTRRRTRRGWRLLQHGTVLSEVLLRPGPTHSVFDVLAAACLLHPDARDMAMLGFGGGSTVAALRALGSHAHVHGVDLDPHGLELLTQGGAANWLQPFAWSQGDAIPWLRGTRRRFDVVVEDLSVPLDADIEKPASTWGLLPTLIAERLQPGGLAVFNLLRPPRVGWEAGLRQVASPFQAAVMLTLNDFQNRILIAGGHPLAARTVGSSIRHALRRIGSEQAERLAVRSVTSHLKE